MKKLFTLICLFVSYHTLAQVNLSGSEDHLMLVGIGADQLIAGNGAFNSWSELHYHTRLNHSLDGNLDFSIISKSYDFGFTASLGDPYGLAAIYAGKRLTSRNADISSFLNFQLGSMGFNAPSVDAPLNYMPTGDLAGKPLHLHFAAVYAGLSSRNYLNKLHFNTGKGKNKASYNSGFFVDLNDEPWGGNWRYGYDKGSGRYARFIGDQVPGIPLMNPLFMDAGIFMTIGN